VGFRASDALNVQAALKRDTTARSFGRGRKEPPYERARGVLKKTLALLSPGRD